LPISASRGSLFACSPRCEPDRAVCAPVFKPLFFQVKPLPCRAARMVSERDSATTQHLLRLVSITMADVEYLKYYIVDIYQLFLRVYVVFMHLRQSCFIAGRIRGHSSAVISAVRIGLSNGAASPPRLPS
jgi:hypothetical protein